MPPTPPLEEADARQRAKMNKTHTTLATLGTLTALALTGCSGRNASPAYEDGPPVGQQPHASLFAFQHPGYDAGAELTIRIPDDLIKAAGANRTVDGYTRDSNGDWIGG